MGMHFSGPCQKFQSFHSSYLPDYLVRFVVHCLNNCVLLHKLTHINTQINILYTHSHVSFGNCDTITYLIAIGDTLTYLISICDAFTTYCLQVSWWNEVWCWYFAPGSGRKYSDRQTIFLWEGSMLMLCLTTEKYPRQQRSRKWSSLPTRKSNLGREFVIGALSDRDAARQARCQWIMMICVVTMTTDFRGCGISMVNGHAVFMKKANECISVNNLINFVVA